MEKIFKCQVPTTLKLNQSATNYLSCRRERRQHDAQPASAEGDQGEQEENGGQQRQQQQQQQEKHTHVLKAKIGRKNKIAAKKAISSENNFGGEEVG